MSKLKIQITPNRIQKLKSKMILEKQNHQKKERALCNLVICH
jgi:hypothetical protein